MFAGIFILILEAVNKTPFCALSHSNVHIICSIYELNVQIKIYC